MVAAGSRWEGRAFARIVLQDQTDLQWRLSLKGRGVRGRPQLLPAALIDAGVVLLSTGSRRRNLKTGGGRLPFEGWSEGCGGSVVFVSLRQQTLVVVHLETNKSRMCPGREARPRRWMAQFVLLARMREPAEGLRATKIIACGLAAS